MCKGKENEFWPLFFFYFDLIFWTWRKYLDQSTGGEWEKEEEKEEEEGK